MKTDIGNRIKKLEKRLCEHVDSFKLTIICQWDYETDEEFEADLEKYHNAGYHILVDDIPRREGKPRGKDRKKAVFGRKCQ